MFDRSNEVSSERNDNKMGGRKETVMQKIKGYLSWGPTLKLALCSTAFIASVAFIKLYSESMSNDIKKQVSDE